MKRVVQCPKCEAKLAVFDIGKTINQKCPKCGESFAIESQEKKGEPAAQVKDAASTPEAAKPAEATPAPDAKADKPSSATPAKPEKADATTPAPAAKQETADVKPDPAVKPEEKTPAKAEAAASVPAVSDKKEVALKKPASPALATPSSKPAAAPAPALADPVLHHCGFSFMNLVTIIVLLAIIIVMQVFAKIQSEKQYKKVIEHLQFIESKIGK